MRIAYSTTACATFLVGAFPLTFFAFTVIEKEEKVLENSEARKTFCKTYHVLQCFLMVASGLNSLPRIVHGHNSGVIQASLYCTVPCGQKQPSLHLPLVGTTAEEQVGSTSGPQGK